MTPADVIQILVLLAAVGASVVALVVSAKDRANARQIAIDDRAAAARVAAEDRRQSLHHARLLRELDILSRLLENLNRGGSSDAQERTRLGAEALTLIGQLSEERLPTLWNERAGDEERLRAAYEDPEMPQHKKNAIEAQLAVLAILREVSEAADAPTASDVPVVRGSENAR